MTAGARVNVQVEVPGTAEHLGELHAALDRFWDWVEAVLPAPPEMEWAGCRRHRHRHRMRKTSRLSRPVSKVI
jgi:hypothetical protein